MCTTVMEGSRMPPQVLTRCEPLESDLQTGTPLNNKQSRTILTNINYF